MKLFISKAKARNLSRKYGFWYVQDMGDGTYKPWAHRTDKTVYTFFNGEVFTE